MQAIARDLFPNYGAETAVIHYENSREKACRIVRVNDELATAI